MIEFLSSLCIFIILEDNYNLDLFVKATIELYIGFSEMKWDFIDYCPMGMCCIKLYLFGTISKSVVPTCIWYTESK
jgi:hypothetical protein